MAENLRSTDKILEELFKGRDSALERYAKVRHTYYELNLWRRYGLPLSEVPKGMKFYFSQRFLGKKRIEDATEAELTEAFTRLGHAINDGCKRRCGRLVDELNLSLSELGLRSIKEPEKFLDWLTFDYEVRTDGEGNPVIEKPFGFEVRIFKDENNRKKFWSIIQLLIKNRRMMSMHDIVTLMNLLNRYSVRLRD